MQLLGQSHCRSPLPFILTPLSVKLSKFKVRTLCFLGQAPADINNTTSDFAKR